MGVPLPRRKSSGFKLEKGIGIDHVKVGMKMVASLAEGIDFPGLKGAAFLAYEIVEVADVRRRFFLYLYQSINNLDF